MMTTKERNADAEHRAGGSCFPHLYSFALPGGVLRRQKSANRDKASSPIPTSIRFPSPSMQHHGPFTGVLARPPPLVSIFCSFISALRLTAFSWWFLLRKIVRISKENNITSIADFISSRYGKSQWLGAMITIIAMLGIMPYIALQLKAVSTTFAIITGYSSSMHLFTDELSLRTHPGFFVSSYPEYFQHCFRRPASGFLGKA